MEKTCCYQCPRRRDLCHANCPDYQKLCKERQKRKEETKGIFLAGRFLYDNMTKQKRKNGGR